MKFLNHFFLLFLCFYFLSVLNIRAQERPTQTHYHKVFEKIDEAYRQGEINLDKKVLYKFYASKTPAKLPPRYRQEIDGILKCGTPAISDYQNHKSQLSKASISEIESLMRDPQTQASETYQSPSGKFTLFYETTGANAVPQSDSDNDGVPDYVEWTAEAADSSWNHEVSNLGYTDPVVGSSDPYKIYIEVPFFGPSTYGETHIGSYKNVNDPTIIVINNTLNDPIFQNNSDPNPTRGAIKVTVAHEFKHAVQYTANQWSGETGTWLEMDATLMEETVYDNVNDYYNYISSSASIFSNPQQSFYPGSYFHVTWALYFEEQFGPQFWVDVWEIISANPNIAMVDAMTQQLGGTDVFSRNYAESQLWHYASGANSIPGYGFQERVEYPTPRINFKLVGDDSLAMPDTLRRFSASYFDIDPSPFPGTVELNFSDFIPPRTGFGVIAYFEDGSAEPRIFFDDQQESIEYTSDWQWQEIQKLGIIAANSSYLQSTEYGLAIRSVEPQIVSIEQNYPNPFSEQTNIRYSITSQQHVKIDVFDILGRKVATLVDQELPSGIYNEIFRADGRASGVYIYRVIIDGEITTKKMALIK